MVKPPPCNLSAVLQMSALNGNALGYKQDGESIVVLYVSRPNRMQVSDRRETPDGVLLKGYLFSIQA